MRRQFVLFGSSIVQYSFHDGWGANLAHIYARKADIILRGYAGWNSRRALKVVDTLFPEFAPKKPDLVIVYFGGNDSTFPHESGYGPHVPLEEYKDNIRKIAQHLKGLKKPDIIFLTPPPIVDERVNNPPRPPGDDEKLKNSSGESEKATKTNEECGKYAKACEEVCNEENVKVINLWEIIQAITNWENDCICDDGVHLTAKGNEVVSNEILNILKKPADWKPSLHYDDLPAEFGDDSPYDPVILHHNTINISHAPFPYPKMDNTPASKL